jgi:hypothetical protein
VGIAPLTAGELWHLAEHGHLAFGLHADAVHGPHLSFGIPGVHGAYSVRLVNLTPMPLPARACLPFSDTSYIPPLLYRYKIERWARGIQKWVTVLALPAGGCEPLPLVRKVLWPGVPVDAVAWEATAARDGLHKGDRIRFTVFTDFTAGDGALLQGVATSQAIILTEEGTASDASQRAAE